MYYPSINWQDIWSTRPSHANGDSEEQTQNGTEPMDTGESGGGSVALRGKRKAATIHSSRPNRISYHEAIKIDEVGVYACVCCVCAQNEILFSFISLSSPSLVTHSFPPFLPSLPLFLRLFLSPSLSPSLLFSLPLSPSLPPTLSPSLSLSLYSTDWSVGRAATSR